MTPLSILELALEWKLSDRIFVMEFVAYLDDTGHESDPKEMFIGVGGGTATLAQWQQVDMLWSASLADAGIFVFHVNEFEQFRKSDPERASILIDKLTAITLAYVRPVIAFGNQAIFYSGEAKVPSNISTRRHALDFAAQWCFEHIAIREMDHDRTHVVFAKTPQYSGRIVELFEAVKEKHPAGNRLIDIVPNHTPANDKRLQVADLIVSGFMKGWKRRENTGQWYDKFVREIYHNSGARGDWRYFGYADLVNWTPLLDEDA